MGLFSGGENQERRNALAKMLADAEFQNDIKQGLLGAVQGVGRGISADLLGGPVDMITMAMNVPAGLFGKKIENPVGGSEWIGNQMEVLGLLPKKVNTPAETGGRILGGLLASPQVVGKVGQAVESGGRQALANAMTPKTLHPQAGVLNTEGLTREQSREKVRGAAENLAKRLRESGFEATVDHSGSALGPSSYVSVFDPETRRFVRFPARFSNHSKGPRESQGVFEMRDDDDSVQKFVDLANSLRAADWKPPQR